MKDGLPNDHIFAVKADRRCVWVGTEDGLACYDKRTGEIRSWKEKDGLPWRVVSAIEVHPKTGEVWLGLFGGGQLGKMFAVAATRMGYRVHLFAPDADPPS